MTLRINLTFPKVYPQHLQGWLSPTHLLAGVLDVTFLFSHLGGFNIQECFAMARCVGSVHCEAKGKLRVTRDGIKIQDRKCPLPARYICHMLHRLHYGGVFPQTLSIAFQWEHSNPHRITLLTYEVYYHYLYSAQFAITGKNFVLLTSTYCLVQPTPQSAVGNYHSTVSNGASYIRTCSSCLPHSNYFS